MQKRINFICAVLALFCFISMYMPVIAPRYPTASFYAPEGNSEYINSGEYYLAKRYWNLTDLVFANLGVLGRIILSLDQAMLLLWAWQSVRGETRWSLAVALVNIAVVAAALIILLPASWACRWGILAMMGLIMAASAVMGASASPRRRAQAPGASKG